MISSYGGYMNRKMLSLLLAVVCLFAVVLTVSADDFSDDFSDADYSNNGWYSSVLLGNPNGEYLFPERRRISFHMPNYDTTVYFINEDAYAENNSVEATFENVFSRDLSYGIVCRYHDYGWYELRVNIAGEFAGSYTVYKYDQYLKEQGKNPYVILHPGMDRFYSYDIKLGINQKNTLKMECNGDSIRVYINGNEQLPVGRNQHIVDDDFTDGDNGVVIINWSGANAQIDVTKFSTKDLD